MINIEIFAQINGVDLIEAEECLACFNEEELKQLVIPEN